jgi:hypothetical protein
MMLGPHEIDLLAGLRIAGRVRPDLRGDGSSTSSDCKQLKPGMTTLQATINDWRDDVIDSRSTGSEEIYVRFMRPALLIDSPINCAAFPTEIHSAMIMWPSAVLDTGP